MEKVRKLRKILIKEHLDGYIIPKNDEFFSEYIPDHHDRLKYITNFSGSFGFSLIMKNKNYLFVDGRYSLQATMQSGNNFRILTFPKKMPKDILKNKKLLIGFDPKLITKKTLKFFFVNNSCIFKPIKRNLIDQIWDKNIKKKNKKFYRLPNYSVDQNYRYKIIKIVHLMKKRGLDYQLVTASENNAWLLNIRGGDSKFAPIPNCYSLIDKNENIKLFCDLRKIPSSFQKDFKRVSFIDIKLISKVLEQFSKKKFSIDQNTCSIFLENIILKKNKILYNQDTIYNLKAIKGKKEIKNIELAHIYDGIALTKYLFWVKKNFKNKKISEISGSQKLLEYRKKNKTFKFISFPTISGSGPNGSIIHYNPTEKTNRFLKKGEVYLVDSGGQYEFGTTDVTRTISLDNSNSRIKDIFTRVLKGHIAVANFQFKKNTTGSKIDSCARRYLKEINLDYSHGTGHGVGYFLNVHEGPHSISKNSNVEFKEGMIVSNEPGYYEKNKFGIRIENLVYLKKNKKKRYLKNLTMVPIDKDLINIKLLNSREIKWLNDYHKIVFKNLKKSMNKNEILDLEKACSAI